MIILQGMDDAENTFLNLGGMFAIVVALIPTGLGSVFQNAATACKESAGAFLTQSSSKSQCPSAQALEEAARANVRNNMVTLLVVGGLILIIAGLLLSKARQAGKGGEPKNPPPGRGWVHFGFFAAVVVWLGGLIALTVSLDWLASNGHYIAGGGLLLCIVAVAVANAHHGEERPSTRPKAQVLKSPQAYPYTWAAIAMVIISIGLICLWQFNVIALFWLEILVAFMFILFWLAQTLEPALSQRAAMHRERIGRQRLSDEASVLSRQRLAQPQVVAAGVADTGVADPVGLVDRLLEDLDAGRAQRLEGLVQVVDLDEDGQVALGDELPHRLAVGRRDVVVHRRQQQVVVVAGSADGEPAHLRPHRDVVVHFEAEQPGVEGQRLVEVGAVHGCVRD
jgi:hypothetical protein